MTAYDAPATLHMLLTFLRDILLHRTLCADASMGGFLSADSADLAALLPNIDESLLLDDMSLKD